MRSRKPPAGRARVSAQTFKPAPKSLLGIASDDGVGVLSEGTALLKAVAVSDVAKARGVGVRVGRVVEDDLSTDLLPPLMNCGMPMRNTFRHTGGLAICLSMKMSRKDQSPFTGKSSSECEGFWIVQGVA